MVTVLPPARAAATDARTGANTAAMRGFGRRRLDARQWRLVAAVVLVLVVMLGFLSMMEKAAQFDYNRHGFEGYPGNLGLNGARLS